MAITATLKQKIVGLGFLSMIGVGIIVISIIESRDAAEAATWPARKGIVTHSEVRQARKTNNEYRTYAYITGKYADTKRPFKISRLSYGQVNSDQKQRDAVSRHPADSEITVYVNPLNSGEVILDNTVDPTTMKIVKWVGISLIGLAVLLWFIVKPPQATEQEPLTE